MNKELKLLLYTCKTKPYLNDYRLMENCNQFVVMNKPYNQLNGKIVAECEFEVEEINYFGDDFGESELYTETLNIEELVRRSCVGINDLYYYLQNKYFQYEGYAIHIKNLHIFDEPKELSDYYTRPKKVNTLDGYSYTNISLDRAPQNMMYCCDEEENDYILISIQSQWMCLILNRIKDVEIRRVILKEMLNNE